MTQPTPNGILLIDKPRGITSHDVVDRIRRVAGTRRVGHAGTLDPLASGLLVVCVGAGTSVAQFLTGLDKDYLGAARLGAISSTYDAEGEITEHPGELPRAEELEAVMLAQTGSRMQLPPPHSAVKVGGRKLYDYARRGEVVPIKPRQVRIVLFDLLHYEPPLARFHARVGSGTYIRSMVHDAGLALGCGAYLNELRRTRVGGFTVDQAIELEHLRAEPDLLPARLLNISEGLVHLPKLTIEPAMETAIRNGRPFATRNILEFEGILSPGQPVLVIDSSGRALSVALPEPASEEEAPALGVAADLIFKPVRVLAPA